MAVLLQHLRCPEPPVEQMLTFLSRSFGRILNRQRALPARAEPVALLAAPRLRLVTGSERLADIGIAETRPSAGAFVAGQGARIYSIEAFRRTAPPARPPQRAA